MTLTLTLGLRGCCGRTRARHRLVLVTERISHGTFVPFIGSVLLKVRIQELASAILVIDICRGGEVRRILVSLGVRTSG